MTITRADIGGPDVVSIGHIAAIETPSGAKLARDHWRDGIEAIAIRVTA